MVQPDVVAQKVATARSRSHYEYPEGSKGLRRFLTIAADAAGL
jgi:hypothetical protein